MSRPSRINQLTKTMSTIQFGPTQHHPWSLLNWVETVSINWHPWQVHQSGLRSAFCGQRCWKLSLSRNFQNPAGANWPNFFPTSSKPLCIMDNWLKSWAKTGEIDRKQTFYRFCRNETADEGFPQPFCRCHEIIAKFPIPRWSRFLWFHLWGPHIHLSLIYNTYTSGRRMVDVKLIQHLDGQRKRSWAKSDEVEILFCIVLL